MGEQDALDFCNRWMPAWTGNRPAALLDFYAEDAHYRDPARPAGLRGHAEIAPYFTKLLAANPDWVWTTTEVTPTHKGFTMKWHARIPAPGGIVVEEDGLDIVEISNGKITRNEVYFDRAALAKAMK